jgi:aspartyl aminopeptidase
MKSWLVVPALILTISQFPAGLAAAAPRASQEDESDSPRSAWLTTDSALRQTIDRHAGEYKSFMNRAKTELSFVSEAIELVRQAGFRELREDSDLTPGARFYDVNRDRTLALIVMGQEDMTHGFRVIGAHIDSPRLEVKPRALYKAQEFALFQTNYHGGLKTYEWTNIPLALMGRVDKKDGTTIRISVGNEPGDPVFVIPDLSPHVDRSLRERKNREVIAHEEMDPLVGHIPKEGEDVKAAIADHLKSTYDVDQDDFISAELALVPAYPARDVGFDRGLMAIYGQDDRLSGYAALRAILDVDTPRHTGIAFLVDNEETGSFNNTGARSTYLVDLMSRLMYMKMAGAYREQALRQALRATKVVSSDVNPGVNPLWPSAWELTNAPRVGHGVNIKLYGRGFNANSEYIAWMRNLLDGEQIPWQTATYKVGRAGGGTIGVFLSDDNMDVIDIGVPVLSIHTPYSISSKIDVYYLYRAMMAFYSK